MKKIIISVFTITLILSSCLKHADITCNFNACSLVATNTEILAWQNYLSTNSLTAVQHCSGLFYRIENPGTGSMPAACSNILVRYRGMFTNGTVFDQSATAIPLNLAQAITAWKIGLSLLKAGGRIVLYVPPSLGYGNQNVLDLNGNVVIPANSNLIFEVELDAVQ